MFPLGLATTLTFSSQFFVLLLTDPMLREHVTMRHVLAATLGFMGVIVASDLWQPHQIDWGVLYDFVSSFMGAVMLLMMRSLTRTDSAETILFYMPLVVFVTSLPQVFADWRPISAEDAGWLCLFGLSGTVTAWGFVEDYRYGRPAVLAPWTYFRLAAGLIAGTVIFYDPLTMSMAVGSILIVMGALFPRGLPAR
ncbi:MAG: DMT family transporter [Acidobacteria bacterium]|nr:DMT family transporter [Acidobacteriota bacterium]